MLDCIFSRFNVVYSFMTEIVIVISLAKYKNSSEHLYHSVLLLSDTLTELMWFHLTLRQYFKLNLNSNQL